MDRRETLLLARARWLAASGHGRQIRETAGLSLREVASAIGVQHSTVAGWESGKSPRGTAATRWAGLLADLSELPKVSA